MIVFQAEDGIRDYKVTGVQTCALPISVAGSYTVGPSTPCGRRSMVPGWFVPPATTVLTPVRSSGAAKNSGGKPPRQAGRPKQEIGRASCRERVETGRVVVGEGGRLELW